MTIGLLLLAAALVLTVYNIWESKQAEKFSNAALEEIMAHIEQINVQEGTSQEMEVPDYVLFPDKEMPVILVDGEYYVGAAQIPELDLTLPIIAGEWSYAKLRKSPCVYAGSIYKDPIVYKNFS